MCDHKTCKEDEFETESAEQTLELKQQEGQDDLENVNVRAEQDASVFRKLIKPIKAQYSAWGNAYRTISQATPRERRFFSNKVEFNKIKISQLSIEEKKEALDALF